MRNLKRALSLALAFVMVMSLMIVGTSAKSYTDADKIDNQAAVEVLGEIGVMVGNDDGTFAPDRVVTRAEMAVILTRILYGNNMNVDQFKGLNTFTDVPDWAEGFVNLCASLDIIAGRGNGIFDPDATVTTAEAALMLSRALGYFKNNAEFGNDWALAAVKRATQAGIIGGDMVLAANEGLTRDDVAQMTFNTLTKAVPVQYNELLNVYYNENKGILYSLTFYYTDTLGYKNFDLVYRSNDRGDYGRPSTTWGTGYYTLTNSGTDTSGNDEYGLNEDGSLNPDFVMMLDEDEIITVANTPTYTYDSSTNQNVVFNNIGRTALGWNDWTAYVDGTLQNNATRPINDRDSSYDYTADGATTEVYIDPINQEVTVVQINYYMGEVADIREDDNGEYASVRVLTPRPDPLSDVVDDHDIYCKGFAEDDYVVFTVDVNEDGDSFIKTIAAPQTTEGTVTRVKEDADPEQHKGASVILDGKDEYAYSDWTASDLDGVNDEHPTLDTQYRLYLDPNGYVIGFVALEKYYDNYLYVKEAEMQLGKIKAILTLTDGTDVEATIAAEYIDDAGNKVAFDADGNGQLGAVERAVLRQVAWGWTESNGTYTLREITDLGTVRLNNYRDTKDQATGNGNDRVNIYNGSASIQAPGYTYIVDADTLFVDVDENVVYTGFENVPDYLDTDVNDPVMFWAIDGNEDNVTDVVFIYGGEASNDNKTYFYVADEDDYWTYNNNSFYKEHDLFVDGEPTTLVFTQTAHNAINAQGLYCVERTNKDGIVTDVSFIPYVDVLDGDYADEFLAAYAQGNRSFALDITGNGLTTDDIQYVIDKDTIIVTVDYMLTDNSLDYRTPSVNAHGSLKDLDDDDEFVIRAFTAKTSNSGKTADLVYIVRYERGRIAQHTVNFAIPGQANFTLTDENGKVVNSGAQVKTGDKLTVTYSAKDPAAYTISVQDANGTPINSGDVITVANANDVRFTINANAIAYADVTLEFQQNANVTINGVTYNETSTDKVADMLTPGQQYRVSIAFEDGLSTLQKTVIYNGAVINSRGGDYYITAVAGADLQIGVATADLALPTGVTAQWTMAPLAGGEADAAETTEIPVGAQVVLTGITGDYGKDGAALPAKNFKMTADKAISADDFGYVEVKAGAVTISDTTFSDAHYQVTAAMAKPTYVKLNTATDVVVNITVERTDGTGTLGTARDVVVTGGTASGTGFIANGIDYTTAQTKPLTVNVTAADELTLTFEVTN